MNFVEAKEYNTAYECDEERTKYWKLEVVVALELRKSRPDWLVVHEVAFDANHQNNKDITCCDGRYPGVNRHGEFICIGHACRVRESLRIFILFVLIPRPYKELRRSSGAPQPDFYFHYVTSSSSSS